MTTLKPSIELDDKYLDEIENITFNPIFILGAERSGTSILYKLLNATNCFNPVTAYHVIKYSELLHNHINNLEKKSKEDLIKIFKKASQMDRGIDRLKITPEFPEEYRFVLGQKTGQGTLNPKTLKIFIELCKKIRYISENDKPILLKNPLDFSNFMYIKVTFPNAKFVFIHRNPIKTLNSQIKAMRTLLKNKSEYMTLLSPQYNEVFENKILLIYYRFLYSSITPIRAITAVNKLANSTDYFLNNINSLTQNDYVSTRYEDICREPDAEIEKIMYFLNIKPKSDILYSDFIKPRTTTELKELQKIKRFILKRMKDYISYCKYSSKDLFY
jgi:hypothetical protein